VVSNRVSTEADGSILVVDDDVALARMLRVLLVSEGYEVTVAGNGLEALEYLKESSASLILLDLQMPVMDGRSFFQELRSKGDNTPVIILSAYNADRACRELGADAALSKPADPDAIGTLVREVLADGARAP
jgi:CheY-like chemotaxis protein